MVVQLSSCAVTMVNVKKGWKEACLFLSGRDEITPSVPQHRVML